jgi:hypothetical protein
VVTDGAWLPDGRGFVLRDYQDAYVYAAPGRRVGAFELPLQQQGESLTASADGRSVLAGSEGVASEVWRVPLPASALAQITPTTTSSPPTPQPAAAGGSRWGAAPFLAVAAGAMAILAVAVLRRRRRS